VALRHAQADEGGQAAGQHRVAAGRGRVGLFHPGIGEALGHPRQPAAGRAQVVALADQGIDLGGDRPGQLGVRHPQLRGRAQGLLLGQQAGVVAGIEQPAREHGLRAGIALGAIGE
jgi:hypothetical protein